MFPSISRSYIEHCQFSSWHPGFARISSRATVIRPLSDDFRQYLEDDCVIVPDGSEDIPATSSLSDESSETESDDEAPKRYAFPELDAQIRNTIVHYGAVFPKLNWTSPRASEIDAAWILPTLKCTSPADVYLLLKSSDFVSHDLDPMVAFEGCPTEPTDRPKHQLELVLKKWYAIDRGREFRCFVRNETLLGISQRDFNYYPHLNEGSTKSKIISTLSDFWVTKIRQKFKGGGDYIFDIHLTRDLSSAHLLDINPYHPKTDSLLFTYDELLKLFICSDHPASDPNLDASTNSFTTVLRVIESASDSAATRNGPACWHNAVPFDALRIGTGNNVGTFASCWEQELKRTLEDIDNSDSAS